MVCNSHLLSRTACGRKPPPPPRFVHDFFGACQSQCCRFPLHDSSEGLLQYRFVRVRGALERTWVPLGGSPGGPWRLVGFTTRPKNIDKTKSKEESGRFFGIFFQNANHEYSFGVPGRNGVLLGGLGQILGWSWRGASLLSCLHWNTAASERYRRCKISTVLLLDCA